MAKEVKQWITVKGNRVPIFEGESKADAIKRMVNRQKKSDKAVKKRYEEKDEVRYEPEDFEDDDREEMIEEALKANKLPRSVREDIEKNGTKKEKALLNRYSKKNQQSKDENTKAKQIARNKKEADERNGKTSGSNKYTGKETKMADDIGTKNLMDVPVGTVINSDGEKWKKVDKDVWSHGELRWGSKDVYRQRLEGGDEVEFSYPSRGSVTQGVKNEKKIPGSGKLTTGDKIKQLKANGKPQLAKLVAQNIKSSRALKQYLSGLSTNQINQLAREYSTGGRGKDRFNALLINLSNYLKLR